MKYLCLADTDEDAVALAKMSWKEYQWRIYTPRREAARRGLHQFVVSGEDPERPKNAPKREASAAYAPARSEEERRRRTPPGGIDEAGKVVAGTPASIRQYLDEYVTTGANYLLGAFQWGSLTHEQAMRFLDLFIEEVMPHYVASH